MNDRLSSAKRCFYLGCFDVSVQSCTRHMSTQTCCGCFSDNSGTLFVAPSEGRGCSFMLKPTSWCTVYTEQGFKGVFKELTTQTSFVVMVVFYSGKKKRGGQRVEYPGESSEFSPYHLHDYFHSARKTATSRFHFADVSSKLTPPARAWCSKLVNKPSLKTRLFLSSDCVRISAEAERVPLRIDVHPRAATNRRVCFHPAFSTAYSDTWTGNSP